MHKRKIKFKPLRRIKKTGKITVASYMQWRKIMAWDHSPFILEIDNEIFPGTELVYNHRGEQLYFYDYLPHEVPAWENVLPADLKKIFASERYGIAWSDDGQVNYNMKGTDCEGVPCFSHYTAKRIFSKTPTPGGTLPAKTDIKPLDVHTVNVWLNWFLILLKNAQING